MSEPSTPKPRKSPGYWRSVWREFRRNRRGLIALGFVVALMLASLLSPLLATNQPIVCRYQGSWYFPAVAWDWLFAGTYFVRATDLAKGKHIGAWSFTKTKP